QERNQMTAREAIFFTSLPVKQQEEFTTTSVTKNDEGRATTADSDSSTAVSHTTSHPLRLIVSYACCCCCSGGGGACMKWSALNMNEGQSQLNCFCDEYWLRFPWTNDPRGVRGSFLFCCYFAFVLLCALHLFSCVCAYPP
ncbi:trans-sialidase, partial [Trypanosoma cruzi]